MENLLSFNEASNAIAILENNFNEALINVLNKCSDDVIISVTGTEWIDDNVRYPIKINFDKLDNVALFAGKVHGNNTTRLINKPLL